LARMIENQNYSKWQNIEADWPNLISKIKFEYEIKSRISKSFILNNE
jgi:hypothetical protein